MHREANELAALYPEVQWISHILPDEHLLPVHPRQPQPLFDKAHSHVSMDETTAFLLTRTPHRSKVTIDDAAALYHLPDFRPALVDFYCGQLYEDRRGRRSNSNYILPFTHINIWHNVRLQQRSAQDQRTFMPVQTIQALPPCQEMPFGRFHTPLVNFSSQAQNESSGVVEVRLIFQPILPADASTPAPYLFYGHYLKFESTDQDGSPLLAPNIDMFVLVQLVPKFGQEAPVGLDYNNSMAFTDRFYLNNFSHKETFHAILSYQ
ncbi:hypothetical protein NLJ89_g5815 [Agrocybe chaxingu]|uniref:DUF6830 domain-containing protein n=1 Tax=Agrocybe chaxingu TaxID=84603 RepID=A0A9W8MTA5_9AGAR|nr:hypothetical protein NLJ89_g5815 [Agrocybe chaxingu]